MIQILVSSLLWTLLIVADIAISIRLGILYRRDSDKRKLMFICGLLLCSFAYFAAILGIDSFPLSRSIFEWCPLPIEFAFIFSLLNDRFKDNEGKFFNGFLIVFAVTIGLFFVPLPPLTSTFALLVGMTFLIGLAIVRYIRDFDVPSVTLVFSIPSFAVCFIAIGQNITELAIFAGFMAKIFLIFSFELARKQSGNLSSVFALKKKLGNAIENFDTLFHLLPDPAVILDIRGNVLEASLSFAKMTGLKKEDVVGVNIFTQNFLSVESKAKLEKSLTHKMSGEQIAPYEMDIISKDKKTFQFELNSTRIEYKNTPAEIVVFRDLTERNKLLEFTTLLFEYAPDPYYLSDLRGNFVDGNKAAQDMVGYDKKELIGKSFLDLKLLQKRQIPKAAKLLALNRLGKRTGPDEFVLNHKGNTQISVEISTFPLKIREQTVVLGIARDVTERKRAEKAIIESEEKFRSIFEKAQDGLLLLGLDGKVADINPKAAEIFDLNKQSAIGRSLAELGFSSIAQIIPKNSDQTKPIQNKLSQSSETTIIRKDGETKHLEVTSSLVKKRNVRVGVLSVVRDVTERKKMEERIVNSERMAAIGQLATMVAHDLRNPLQSIATATFCLQKSKLLEGNDRMLTVIRNIKESVDYSEKIVRDLLDYSHITLDVSNNDPRSIVGRTLSMMTIPTNVEVFDLTSSEPPICVDADKIVRVCINLITNALDAMPNGGTLTITSKKAEGNLLLSFADSGEGISKEKIKQIWTPLFTTKAKGIGLGLPICKRIIDAHNGDILVESENGRGATVTIVLPITTSRKKNEVYVSEMENIRSKVNNGTIETRDLLYVRKQAT